MLLLILIVGVAIVAMLATGARGGPLDPTSAPGPTDGVREPGTPITSIPFTIAQPGFYYLTHNLTASADGQNGITVSTDDVTLDLKGFTLKGSNKTGSGISANGQQFTVTNGVIEAWDIGVSALGASYARYADLQIAGNTLGIAAHWAAMEDCSIVGNARGMVADNTTVRHCLLINNSDYALQVGTGSVIEDNQFEGTLSGSPQSADIVVNGNDNVIRDNVSRTGAAPFVRLLFGAAANAIMRNRYACAAGIVTNPQFNYIPTTVDVNICF